MARSLLRFIKIMLRKFKYILVLGVVLVCFAFTAHIIMGRIFGAKYSNYGWQGVLKKAFVRVINPEKISDDFYLSFENNQEVDFFSRKDGLRAQASEVHATDGQSSLMVEFPGGTSYPGLQFEVFGNQCLNWKGEKALSFDVYNDNGQMVHLKLKIKSGKAYPKKTFERIINLPSQELMTINIPIDELSRQIDITLISYVNLFMEFPKETIRLYFDRFNTGQKPKEPVSATTIANRNSFLPSKSLTLDVYPDKIVRPINRMIYGSNLDPKTEFEMDVAKFGKEVGITNFRFPGGGSSGYHWQTGISDYNKRVDAAPLSKIKNLVEYVKIIGAKLVIQVNIESGTPQEAAEWVGFMNKMLGFRVDYWELGNEVYGDWDKAHMSGEEYVKVIKEYAKAMKAVDPTIKIGADFGDPNFEAFNKDVIKGAADDIDFISYHWYPNHISPEKKYKGRSHPLAEEIMANSLAVPQIVGRINQMIGQYAPHRKGKIEMTFMEWDGSWDGASSDLEFSYKGMMWSLANAIFYADTFGQFARNGISVSNQFTFQEVMFGLIRGWDREAGWGGSRWDGEIIRPKALAMKLFSRYFGDTLIESRLWGSPAYHKEEDWRADSYAGDVPYVEAYASRFSNAEELAIIITNKHAQKDFDVTISLNGAKPDSKGLLWVLNGPNLEAQNDGKPRMVAMKQFEIQVDEKFTYAVPAHSISLIAINLKKIEAAKIDKVE